MKDILISNLSEKPEYFSEVIRLVEKSFSYQKNHKFDVDFYPLVNKNNHSNCYILINTKSNKLIGHIGFKKRKVKIGKSKFPIALFGGIAINPEERGKGYFNYLFSEILNKTISQNTFILLWSSEEILYEKYQFFQAGIFKQKNNRNFESNYFSKNGYIKTKLKDLSSSDKKQVEKLFKEKICDQFLSPLRDDSNWTDIENITSSDLFIKKRQDNIVGYFFVNKGQDLTDIIHEYAFHEDFHESELSSLRNFSLWDYHFNMEEETTNLYPSALMKIGDHKLFSQFIHIFSGQEITINKIESQHITYSRNLSKETINNKDFLNQFFLDRKNIYISGLDSI